MSDIGGLQLLPTQKRKINFDSLTGSNKFLAFSIVIFLVWIILFFIFRSMANGAIASVAQIDSDIATIHKTRNKPQEEQLVNFQNQIGSIKALLKSHTVWVSGLRDVQGMIDPRVTFSTLSADSVKRTYTFNAVADSYATVARQVASFYRSEAISNVVLSKVGVAQTGKVEFTIELTFKPDHFLMKS